MSCELLRFQRALELLAAGELSAAEYTALRAHLGLCESCRADHEQLSRIETHLEKRALPEARVQLLETELFLRLGVQRAAELAADPDTDHLPILPPEPRRAEVIRPARWSVRRVAAVAVPLAASVVLAVLVAPRVLAPASEGEYQSRGAAEKSAFGVRAFCVSAQGEVTAEAGPGEALRCSPGSAIQFSRTNPESVALEIVGAGSERLTFFPLDGQPASVTPGTDVPLAHSTPVSEWLDRRMPVTATFTTPDGRVVGQTRIELVPAAE